jgi:hypothetical protein
MIGVANFSAAIKAKRRFRSLYISMDKNQDQTPDKPPYAASGSHISWHPAFYEAIQLELEQYKDALEFSYEYQLSSEPLRIDVVVIKKAKDVVIDKNIAAIFREYNILEFKSPTDYLSVEDLYKVFGYAYLYASLNKVPITSLTISFVESRRPRGVLVHLTEIWGCAIEERGPGVYIVKGDIIPIQIIDSRELSEAENIWLKNLDNELDAPRIKRITAEIARYSKAAQIKAYLDVIVRANSASLKEAVKMSKSTVTLEQVLEETGITARAEARGEVKGKAEAKLEVAKNLIKIGLSLEKVVQATELDLETVKNLQ